MGDAAVGIEAAAGCAFTEGAVGSALVVERGLVQGGEEEILEDSVIIGGGKVRPGRIAGGREVLQQLFQPVFTEEVAGEQAFLLQEPAEDEAGEQADQEQGTLGIGVDLGRRYDLAVGDEVPGPEVPVGDFLVEAVVKRVGVEALLPGLVEGDEVVNGGEGVEVGEGEVVQNLDMGADGIGKTDILDQGGFFENVAFGLSFVEAAVDDGHGQGVAMAQEHECRHRQRLVDGAGDVGDGRAVVLAGW